MARRLKLGAQVQWKENTKEPYILWRCIGTVTEIHYHKDKALDYVYVTINNHPIATDYIFYRCQAAKVKAPNGRCYTIQAPRVWDQLTLLNQKRCL